MFTLGLNITKVLLIYPSHQLVAGEPINTQMKTLTKISQTFPDKMTINVLNELDFKFPTVFNKDAWLNN